MTDPITLAVAAIALLLAFCAAVMMRPRLPDLDGERWFKILIATLLRGRTEADGGDVAEWEGEVHQTLLFHPVGRWAEAKVHAGADYEISPPALEGEEALVEHMALLPSRKERWRWLFHESEQGRVARLQDPQELGPVYAPQTWLGAPFDWDHIADAGVAFGDLRERLRREGVRWIVIGDPTLSPTYLAWEQRIIDELDGVAKALPWDLDDVTVDELAQRLENEANSLSDRFVMVGLGRGIALALRGLASEPAFRDRVLAVVSIGGTLAGYGDGPIWGRESFGTWMSEHFDFESLDTEMARETAYFSIELWDQETEPDGLPTTPIGEMRFPTPSDELAPVEGLHVVDLGLISAKGDAPLDLIVRALWTTVTCWILARVLN